MRKMRLKTKRTLRIAAVIGGVAIYSLGMGLMVKYKWKADDFKYEQNQLAKSLGYEEVKAQLKSDEVAKLTTQLYFHEIEPEDFISQYNSIKEITQDEFMAQYASAEEKEEYANLAEQHDKWFDVSLATGLPIAFTAAVPFTYALGGFDFRSSKKNKAVQKQALERKI